MRTAEEAKLCYPTTLKAFAIIRRAIFVDVLLRKFGRGAEEKNIAFGAVLPAGAVLGVNLEKGIARIEEARNYWPGMTERLPMQSIRYGGICIASSSHTYDLLLYETNKTYLLPQDTASSTWENGSDELSLFVQFLKTRLLKKRRLGIGAFPLTVSEIIFRYNNIGTPLFKNLAELLAAQVEDDL
ncbi:hypothetical protein [Fundidesulfovibrio putealis]|uniref:hypothetical protein n=1 Tax=Fundidesulfovibrio putealis TaxID=270496 RepID=UPI000487EAFA|nr:hypothetical protein [Fundidesulfovibrio putealis]